MRRGLWKVIAAATCSFASVSCRDKSGVEEPIVVSGARVMSITISPRNVATVVRGSVQLRADVVADAAIVDRAVVWLTSSDVVTVSADGLVTGVRGGSAIITARAHADQVVRDSTTVTVFVPGTPP